MIAKVLLIDGGVVREDVDRLHFDPFPRIGDTVEFEGDDGLYIVQSVRHHMWGLNGSPTAVQDITILLHRF